MRRVERTFGLLLALVFARSSTAHVASPYAFLDAISGYQMLDRSSAVIVAAFVPFLQMALAVTLVFHWWPATSYALATFCFLIFLSVQAIAVYRGLDISCGCFGTAASVRVGRSTMIFTAICAVVSMFGWIIHWWQSRKPKCGPIGQR